MLILIAGLLLLLLLTTETGQAIVVFLLALSAYALIIGGIGFVLLMLLAG